MTLITAEAEELNDARRGAAMSGARLLKRFLDIVGAAFGLLLASPVFLVVWILLSREAGPVVFRQWRVGRGGRRFQCLKFRSMRVDAERRLTGFSDGERAEWTARQKLADDPRVTRLGAFIRRWGVDELPQLINVLKGDMSLVGPRPIIAPEAAGYPADYAYARSAAFDAYCAMRPGLTGLWQVSGGAETRHSERVRLDALYVRGWSLWLDLKIMVATPRAVMRRKYG